MYLCMWHINVSLAVHAHNVRSFDWYIKMFAFSSSPQRDIVSSYLESGKPVDEQGVEDSFELLHEVNERVRTGIWVGDCFIYNNSSWRLNYCVGGEVC